MRTLHSVTARALLGLALVAGLTACQTQPSTSEPEPTATEEEPTASPEAEDETADDGEDDGTGADEGDDAAEDQDAEGLVNGPNAITAPDPGASVAGPDVTVTGEGTAFEGTLNYRVVDTATGDVVVDVDYTDTGANGEIGPWSIDLTLEPGEYTVEVWEPNMADGEGVEGDLNPVEVTFTVT